MESPKSPSLTCSSDQSHQVLDSDTDHVEHPAEIPLVDGPEEPLIETQTKVSIPEKLTTDPADLITVTNLSFTWDTDSITKNPEEIQLVYDNTDDDVSIPEQLTDPADLSSSRDTEDSQTKQAEFQLVDRADNDVSIPEQLSTDPADFITVSDLSTVDTEDIPTKPEEIQLVQDSVDDDVNHRFCRLHYYDQLQLSSGHRRHQHNSRRDPTDRGQCR
ncbi:uncharacterized protein LOC125296436 [Alosa alosa]|uniref:uncharacterized protein LOC125296436 n=1 Tax=Alosa alosa TaxID=278164 RepID=UPI0020150602|nr:uncharacterized protein LOC125296436 [Alosa alosa]